jgi:hypothetical protein
LNATISYNQIEKDKQNLIIEQLELHKNFLNKIQEVEKGKLQQIDIYDASETQKLKQEKNFIEEEKERLKINKTHIDLDLKVKITMDFFQFYHFSSAFE